MREQLRRLLSIFSLALFLLFALADAEPTVHTGTYIIQSSNDYTHRMLEIVPTIRPETNRAIPCCAILFDSLTRVPLASRLLSRQCGLHPLLLVAVSRYGVLS